MNRNVKMAVSVWENNVSARKCTRENLARKVSSLSSLDSETKNWLLSQANLSSSALI